MIYRPIHKSKNGMTYTNETAVLEAMDKLGYVLRVVSGQANKYWIT